MMQQQLRKVWKEMAFIVLGLVTLFVLAGPAHAQQGSRLDWREDPTYGTRYFTSRSTLVSTSMLSGGNVNVNLLDLGRYCRGFAATAPDLRIRLTASGLSSLNFAFRANTLGDDTTLIVNDPLGNWHCSDDRIGLNPGLSIVQPRTGQYDIWVGSYYSGEYNRGVLTVRQESSYPGDTGYGGDRGTPIPPIPTPPGPFEIDLRNTAVASNLQSILNDMAQGNEGEASIQRLELDGNVLRFRVRVRHRHSWGFATAYSLTTYAEGNVNVLSPSPSSVNICADLPTYLGGGQVCRSIEQIVTMAAALG